MSDIFDEAFVDMLPSDPWLALEKIADGFNQHAPNQASVEDTFVVAVEAYLLAKNYCNNFLPEIDVFNFTPTVTNHQHSIKQINGAFATARQRIDDRKSNLSFENMQARAAALVDKVNAIEFTSGDLDRIQELINQTRDIVTNSDAFEPRHKQRVLDKLEKLQNELHKRMTKVDDFYLLLPEAGLALGKFGENARPFVEHIKEIMRIVFRYQAQREELPSAYQPDFLPNPEKDLKDEVVEPDDD